MATLLTAALLSVSATPAQPPAVYDELTDTQKQLFASLATPSSAADAPSAQALFDNSDLSFREAFTTVTTALAVASLSDQENGEILGVALDLVAALDPLARQPFKTAGRAQLSVRLAPGARDRLRRSSEFTHSGGDVFVQNGGSALRIALDEPGTRATVSLPP